MSIAPDCPLAEILADRLRDQREALVGRWLERISARVSIDVDRIFPSEELLDHVPLLVDGIADYLEDPAEEVTADAPLVAKAMELGEMRHEQGFEVYQILKEYELLGGILFHFLIQIVDDVDQPCTRGELLACGHRLFRGIAVIQEVTTIKYMQLARVDINEREERLRGFNRALSHEVRNQLGALKGAIEMLGESFVNQDEAMRGRFHGMAVENMEGLERTAANLIELSRLDSDPRQHRNVLLPEAIFEVTRQLRHFAEVRGVTVRTAAELPKIEVPASAVELALTNYLSNAIKYHDPAKEERWVEIRALERDNPEGTGRELAILVADNGRGVPKEARDRLFTRYYRAHLETASEVEGTGLGLSLVRETVEALGGWAWAELDTPGETVFGFAIPSRRAEDRGTDRRRAES